MNVPTGYVHSVLTGIGVSAHGGALFSIISNSGVSLAIQDLISFELFGGGPLVGVNTFQATVTCAQQAVCPHQTGTVCWLHAVT